jgi:uncharacterized glyoxalase superfamily protein PhnB
VRFTRERQKVMKTNRSMPSSVVIPVLAYANVREAVGWLCRAFGLVERLRIGDHRAQLSFGSGAVVIAGQQEPLPQGGFSHSVMARVADIDSHYKHAKKTGARIIKPPPNTRTARGNTAWKISAAICGRSRRRSQKWTQTFGAVHSLSSYSPYLRRSWSAARERA